MNLVCATQFLSTSNYRGVAVCMHENTDDDTCLILPGINTRKMHSSRRDAFKPINTIPIARVDYRSKKVTLLRTIKTTKDSSTEPIDIPETLPLFKEDLKIGLLYSHPNMFAEEILTYKNFDGLVVAGSGLGHLPLTANDEDTKEHESIYSAVESITKKLPVVMSVQTIYGRVHLNVYSPARALRKLGVIGHLNMLTPESTFVKLAWILSNYEKKDVGLYFEKNFVGEKNDITNNEFYKIPFFDEEEIKK